MRIFISYAHGDHPVAKALAEALTAHGFSVWWDHDIAVGKEWSDAIDRELRTADAVIVIWSRNSLASQWVIEEAQEGARRGVLFPIITQDARPPLGFRTYQAIDFSEWEGDPQAEEFQRLIDAITERTGKERRNLQQSYDTAVSRHTITHWKSRNALVSLIAACVSAAYSIWDVVGRVDGAIIQPLRIGFTTIFILSALAARQLNTKSGQSNLLFALFVLMSLYIVIIVEAFKLEAMRNDPHGEAMNFALLFFAFTIFGAIKVEQFFLSVLAGFTIFAVHVVFFVDAPRVVEAGAMFQLAVTTVLCTVIKLQRLRPMS